MEKKNIDWNVIRQHLADTRHVLETNEKSDEEKSHILRQRANDLGKDRAENLRQDGIEVIEFMLGSERYGIESTFVKRICEAKNVTRLPATPEFVDGIINLHGVLVCVINLKALFQLPQSEAGLLNRILIVSGDGVNLGIMADAVTKIESIALDTLQTSLPTLTGTRSEFLLGITHDQQIILNAQKLLTHKDLVINDTV